MSERPLSAIADINPPLPRHVPDSELVSFAGMSDVKESGGITSLRDVPFGAAVKVGFTRFIEGDVLFAKITPCMENGKGALAAGLTNGIGCGSTEFHVLRAKGENCNGFIYQVVQSRAFRQKAEMNMSGSAGQQRVPSDFFKEFPVHIPDPPAAPHRRNPFDAG
jgi:type I restriction enzyme S subunit